MQEKINFIELSIGKELFKKVMTDKTSFIEYELMYENI